MPFNKLTIGHKIGGAFALLAGLSAVIGGVGYSTQNSIGWHGVEIGEHVLPLTKIAQSIQLDVTHAHLLFEEIMAGDDGESIDEVWMLLERAKASASRLIPDAGPNDETNMPGGHLAPQTDAHKWPRGPYGARSGRP